MIRSMTAYARREIKGDWGSAAWELRSVNQRYLETYIRLPEQFRSLEPVIRERIRKGDIKAIEVMLKIKHHRARLAGLYTETPTTATDRPAVPRSSRIPAIRSLPASRG